VSKSLTGAQLRWSTPEKEMYAVYYAVKKLEYLLSDAQFTWRTDHKNNILSRSTGSDKVMRWDLYLQGFQIKKEYIKGEENAISDTFSRLCAVSDPNEYVHPIMEADLDIETLHYLNEVEVETVAAVAEIKRLSTEIHSKISKIHNSRVGHHGVDRSIKKLIKLKQTWPTMKVDVISFIKACPCCQKMSYIRVPIHTSPFTTAAHGLMLKLSIDCIGPLMNSDGYTHILVVIDNFSRYLSAYPIKGTTGQEIARCLIQHIGPSGVLT
jgi:hypothetical protein